MWKKRKKFAVIRCRVSFRTVNFGSERHLLFLVTRFFVLFVFACRPSFRIGMNIFVRYSPSLLIYDIWVIVVKRCFSASSPTWRLYSLNRGNWNASMWYILIFLGELKPRQFNDDTVVAIRKSCPHLFSRMKFIPEMIPNVPGKEREQKTLLIMNCLVCLKLIIAPFLSHYCVYDGF